MEKKKPKKKKIKVRNWLVVSAISRKAGPQKDKSKYTRKPKHKKREKPDAD